MIIAQLNNTEEINRGNVVFTAEKFAVSRYHWGEWKDIKNFLSEIENLYYQPEDFERNLCKLFIDLCQRNTRLKEVNFFQDANNPGHLICFLVDDTKNVYQVPTFEGFISIEMKREQKKFTCVETSLLSFKEGEERKYPEHWQPIPELNRLFEKMSCFI